jgi:tetratricopeptide (TPR) repeat protein
MTSNASADLELMRASMLLESDPAAAARHASDIVANFPGHEEANLLLATACRRLGDPASSTRVLESLSSAHPASPVMQLELGRSYAAGGRRAEALAAFQRAVDLDGTLADGWRELAAQHFLAGNTLDGDAAYLNYSRLAPNPPGLADAYVALTDNRLGVAEAVAVQHLRGSPGDVVALRMLADIAFRRSDSQAAERHLTECLELAPGYAAARYDLARLLYEQQRMAEALPLIERLLATEPRNAAYLTLKAQSIRLVGRIVESIAIMERVVADCPDDAPQWLLFGNLLREMGEQGRSIEAYRRALVAQPGFGEGYWALANLKTFRFTDADIATMQQQLALLPPFGSGRKHLEFALGKAFEDARQFAASFEHYALGNNLQRAMVEYDSAAATAYVQHSKVLYTAGFFADRREWGIERADPIFIVGLPRSGSTLLEQILASHSQVEGTRELPDLPAMVMELFLRANPADNSVSEYPSFIASLGRTDIEQMATRYLAQTQAHRPLGLPRFVDKMLANFSHVGLIQLMFPNASIIDARRHPLACSFSCYKQLFPRGMNFSYDLGELGLYYRDYVELMEHMDEVLPGRVHRVHYEQLIADPEREVSRLLAFCRLPFEADCLRFYQNPRVVQTVSSEQVRRPIYADAVDQWRNYETWLEPLKDALDGLVDRYPSRTKPLSTG